jgi:hypothetical protein
VVQLREIGISSSASQRDLDYYRAFEQRSGGRAKTYWSREIGDYEVRLVDEWGRYGDVVFED